ncbi:interleukin-4 [Mastomys coucha]|uniref:interleukin-4 n=1 Tax=Mastomys coucha TaxID=35658 RepID=UPI001261AD4E|nr:interleukin-4 [Mastomys coucha]
MGFSPQLAVILLCLLACTGNHIHQLNERRLREIINILNQVTKERTPCLEMVVPDVLIATENITDNELICRASKVLRKFYLKDEISLCLKNNSSVLNELQKLFRAFSRNPLKSCTVNESTFTSLKNFLASLKSIMQKKYSQY